MEKIEGNFPKAEKEKLEKVVGENFSNWQESLLSGSPEQVAKIYDEDATFLPTLSDEFKKGRSAAEDYFSHFLEKKPVCEIVEQEVQELGKDCYLHSGMYNFEVGPKGQRQIVEARFTFVWKKDKGEWKIIHHHSSIKPRE